MTKFVLVRHGRSTANADGVLAGRADGVGLDDVGRRQADELARLLASVEVAAVVRSPMLRCEQTADLLAKGESVVDPRLDECHYGSWTGRRLEELANEPLWAKIQASPSTVTFPDGESMADMRHRALEAIGDIGTRHGKDDVVVIVSHGDVIKAILADALALDFDQFQRINVSPASISVVDHSHERAFVVCLNAGVDIPAMLARPAAPVGGGGDIAES